MDHRHEYRDGAQRHRNPRRGSHGRYSTPRGLLHCSIAPSRSRDMHQLEWLAYYIDPPRWPAAIFGAIKPDLAAAGERIFQSRCAGCHEYGDDRRTPTGLISLRGMRPEEIGTDSTAALRISCPVPDTGALMIPPTSYTTADAQLLKDCAGVKAGTAFTGYSFARTVQTAVDGIKGKAYAAAGMDAAQQRVMEDLAQRGSVAWRDTLLRHAAALWPLCCEAALRDLGRGALPAQRIGPDIVRPAASP